MRMATWNYSASIADRLHAGLKLQPSGCVEWTKALSSSRGYGRIARGGRGTGCAGAHRVAWELENGPVPEGLYVLHHCDNPPCCNPDHLFLGSLSDNTQDMLTKGRAKGHLQPGANHPSARLSDAEVQRLRELAPTVGNYAELGRRFGISKQYARSLCLGVKRAS